MIVIVGLVVLLAAVIVGSTGVLTNSGAENPLTANFSVFGYHVTGSTGTLFLFGIVIGAIGMLGLSVLLAGARRTAERGRDARRDLRRSQRETAFLNRDRDQLLEQSQQDSVATSATGHPPDAGARRTRVPLLHRWSRGRHPRETHVDSPRLTATPLAENKGIRNERW
jgi:hypothetical protein